MYTAKDILWIKSTRRDGGTNWAYEELTCKLNDTEPHQKLHWVSSKTGKTSAKHPKIGEIILIFQTLTKGLDRGLLRLTHLVSPVSTDVFEDPTNPDFKWYREVKLIAKAAPINAIARPDNLSFRIVGRGGMSFGIHHLTDKTHDITKVQKLIWNSFRDCFCQNISNDVFSAETESGRDGETEGDRKIRKHIQMEVLTRNSKIVLEKKADAFQKGNGRILCECCDFDFVRTYGVIGIKFIECHHRIFLSTGKRKTRPEHLALVCSNCHRMLHKRKDDKTYHTVDSLKALIQRLARSR
jgi:hypothetical protein